MSRPRIVELIHFNVFLDGHTAHIEYRIHDVMMSHCVDYVLHLHSNVQGDYFWYLQSYKIRNVTKLTLLSILDGRDTKPYKMLYADLKY